MNGTKCFIIDCSRNLFHNLNLPNLKLKILKRRLTLGTVCCYLKFFLFALQANRGGEGVEALENVIIEEKIGGGGGEKY